MPSHPGAATPVDDFVEVPGGVRLHVRRWAPARQNDALADFLLVHGLSSNARLWDAVSARLVGAGHSATAVDLRSHGESDAPEDGYDTGTAADDVAHVARTLGMRHAIVAGQSWGGNVVVRLAAEHPDVVAALALVDGGWSTLSAQYKSWTSVERRLRPPDIDGRPAASMRAMLRSAHPAWSDEAVDATVANIAVQPDGTIRRRLSIPRHMQIVRSMWDDPPSRYYARVHVPVLMMPALPADPTAAAARRTRVEQAAAKFAGATVHEYLGGDHDLHAQQPDQVADDLLALAAAVGNDGPRDDAGGERVLERRD
ncbi:MAG TPA: alpha/beta hydrolase [Micromonosporaceae bacterium]|jgi:pimeloyl-ACP methyl ester carboxylesterase